MNPNQEEHMSLARISLRSCGILFVSLIILAIIFVAPQANSQVPDLVVKVGDTSAAAGELNTAISVFMSNYFDSVAGFNLWLQLDRPDIMVFQNDTQTVVDTIWECTQYNQDSSLCLDSIISEINSYEAVIGNFDTSGTLISGWQYVDVRSLSGLGYDLNIVALADDPFKPGAAPPLAPQNDGLLIKLLADVYNIPDSMDDRTVNVLIQSDFIDHFSFSRTDGTSIGVLNVPVEDTSYWRCTQWAGSTCLQWQKVSLPPYDSTSVDTLYQAVIDTSKVYLLDGSLAVDPPYVCGDVNASQPTTIDIADLVYVVAFMFKSGPEPIPFESGDVNCSNPPEIDISDLVYLVAYMFKSGAAPCASCP
jgi:hypothetical protein